MFCRFDASLNGVSFANLDPKIILTDVNEEPADEDIETARRSLHPGTRLTYKVRRKLSLRFTFSVREYDMHRRSELIDKIADWAGDGGWLVLSSRPNQRLYVHPDTPPSQGSSLRWTDDLEMVLTAYERPYFEARWPTVAVITDSGTITPTGTYPTAYVEVDVANAGDGDLTSITITCADTHITLEGLQVPAGEKVSISYTDMDVMVITSAGASALANRTADSHDDLIAATRKANDIAVEADQPVSATFSARGRYR